MTDTRLIAYAPNGSSLGPLPAPSSLSASYVLNDTGALSFSYDPNAPLSSLLGQPLEIVTQISVDAGMTWTEPRNGRYLLLTDGRDPVKDDAYSLECPSYIFRLTKALVPFTGLDSNGNRVFTTATPGKILNDLFTEAQARGAMAGITWTFTATNDSAGTAWPVATQQTIGYTPGTDFYQVLTGLADAGLVDFSTNGREIQVYVLESTAVGALGIDRTVAANAVTLRDGRDLVEAPFRRTWQGLADTAYVQGDGTSTLIRTNAGAIKPWGRQETYVTAGGVTDTGTLTTVGDGALSQTDDVRVERTYGLVFTASSYQPFGDYGVGEWVFGTTDGDLPVRQRVRSITLTRDGDGNAAGNTVLNDRFVEADIRQQRALNKITSTATQGGSGSTPIGNDILPPAAVGALTSSSTAYLDIHGDVKATLSLDWADVTTNSDGSAMTDLDHYEVHRRRSGETTWTYIGNVNLSQWADSPYEPNESWEFRVCAVDSVYNRGAFSPTKGQTTAADVTGPLAPSQPSGTSAPGADQGSIVIGWDGLNSVGGAMDADLAYVEVHASTTNGFTATGGNAATLKATFPDRRPATVEIGGLVEGTTYYVVLKGRDTSGNYGAQSAQRAVLVAKATDGAVPSAAPANTVLNQFAVGALEARWDAVTNADPVTYDVYLKAGSPVGGVYNSTTFIGSTTATSLPITRVPAGTLLLPATNYYLEVRVRDGDGYAAASSTAGPTQYRKADVDTISASWVYANTVEAAQINSGSVTADWALLGSISVGPNITLKPPTVSPPDPGGLKIVTSSGAGLILLPGDGSAALFRKVAVEADSLLVYDNFELRGVNNSIAGTLKLAKGVSAFQAGPTVVSDWTDPTLSLTLPDTGGGDLCDDGTNWVQAGGISQKVYGYNKTTGVKSTLLDLSSLGLNVVGVTKLGTSFYVLTPLTVRVYSAAWALTGSWSLSGVSGYAATSISADGTTIYVAVTNSASTSTVTVWSMTTAGSSQTALFTTAYTVPTTTPRLYVGAADFGGVRAVIMAGTATVHVHTLAGAVQTAQQWTSPVGDYAQGLLYDGANLRQLGFSTTLGAARVWKLSPVVTALARSVRASKYDSVGTVHETAWSLATAFTQNPREWMKVQTSAPDGSGGADEPNRIRHYIQTTSLSASYFLQPDVTASPWAAWYGTPATGTATAVTGVDFSSVAAVGKITDVTGTYYLDGNGDAKVDDLVANTITTDGLVLPHLELTQPLRQTAADANLVSGTSTLMRWATTTQADATGTITNPNTALNSDGRIVLGKAGIYEIICQYTFASSAAGTTRSLRILLNAGATLIAADSRAPNAANGTTVLVALRRRFAANDYFTTELLQASGGALGVFSTAEGFQHLQVTRLAA